MTDDILPYTDRKALHSQPHRWSTEEIVRAQCLACEGLDANDILVRLNEAGMALGGDAGDVVRVVDNDPMQSRPKTRQAVAGIGYAKVKSGWQ